MFDRWKWLKNHLRAGPLRTLDAGCGSGAFTFYAAKIGNEAVGISFDERNNDMARMRARILRLPHTQFIQADLRDLNGLSSPLGKFDQIICCETIEHIKNDKKLLIDLSALLKPEGRLLLTTPFKHYKPLLGDTICEVENGGHVRWGYTFEDMKSLFLSCGLEIEGESYLSGFITQKLTNLMRRISRINPWFAWLVTFPFRIFQPLDPLLTKLTRYPHMTIGVMGVKRP